MKKFRREISEPDYFPELPTYEMKPIEKVVDGRIKTEYVQTQIDPSKVNDGLSANDFSLDVLIKTNSVDLLKENRPLNVSSTSILNEANKL